jgi:hypothetical protein|nr:MAG TPA: hypothetical protein [Caudoviricetes sp.]
MIAPWPPKPRYKTKRLREAISVTVKANALAEFVASMYVSSREATERLHVMQEAITKALADIDALRNDPAPEAPNRRLARIRDDLVAVIDESARP